VSDTLTGLHRKRAGARDLQSVVRTMKAIAASSIGQYEKSVTALTDYSDTVDLGLAVCLRESAPMPANNMGKGYADTENIGAVIFGSDQGLVGQFNEVLVDFALKTLATLPGTPSVWAVGERVSSRLVDHGLPILGLFSVPNSVKGISPLVGRILVETENISGKNEASELYLFYNRPQSDMVFTPVSLRLLPLDETWRRNLVNFTWPTTQLPEVLGGGSETLRALVREYLFVSLFRACAESLASENASRLAAMQRAEKNIEELLDDLNGRFNRLRQSSIDEELFDVISGFEAVSKHSI
jgi:F-type H+-transporting ATPase subunit gamma